jgi:hypothetical protein
LTSYFTVNQILKAIILEFHNGDQKCNNFNASDAYIFVELLIICSRWLMPTGASVVLVLRRRKLERGYYSDFINMSSFMLLCQCPKLVDIFWSQLISHPLKSFQHWFIDYLLVTRIIPISMFSYYWWFLYLIKFALQKKYRKNRAEKNRDLGVKRPRFQPPEQKPKTKECWHYMKGKCHEVVINSIILNPDFFFTLYHDTFMLVLSLFLLFFIILLH